MKMKRSVLWAMIGTVVIFAIAALLTSCDEHKQSPRQLSARADKGTLASAAYVSSAYPLADGCAYVRGLADAQLWYVCETKAMKVSGASVDSWSDISPLADGGAIASGNNMKSLIYLRGPLATTITEGEVATKPVSMNSAGFNFAMSAAFARESRSAEFDNMVGDK